METPTEADARAGWPKVLSEMSDVIEHRFIRMGKPESEARKLAAEVIVELSTYMGGRSFYLPRGDRLRMAIRDREIAARMGREKVSGLAEEFGVTEIHIYRIVRKQRALERAERAAARGEHP